MLLWERPQRASNKVLVQNELAQVWKQAGFEFSSSSFYSFFMQLLYFSHVHQESFHEGTVRYCPHSCTMTLIEAANIQRIIGNKLSCVMQPRWGYKSRLIASSAVIQNSYKHFCSYRRYDQTTHRAACLFEAYWRFKWLSYWWFRFHQKKKN